MNKLHPHKVGLALGGFMGVFHLLWALAVATGLGQWYLNFIFRLHMIATPTFTTAPFSMGTALGLIVVTAIAGYIMGLVLAWFWNRFVRA